MITRSFVHGASDTSLMRVAVDGVLNDAARRPPDYGALVVRYQCALNLK